MVTQDMLRTHEEKLCFYFEEEKNHRISDRLKTLLDLRFEKKAQIRIRVNTSWIHNLGLTHLIEDITGV